MFQDNDHSKFTTYGLNSKYLCICIYIYIENTEYTAISMGIKIFWPANFYFHRANLFQSSMFHMPWDNLPIFLTILIMYSLYKWYLKIRKNYVSIFMSILDTFTQWTIWMQLSRIHIVVRKFTLNTPKWSFNCFLSKMSPFLCCQHGITEHGARVRDV